MSLPRYSEYRGSGLPWVGDLPAHWDISTLARISLERCDGPFGSGIKSEHYTDEGALVVRLQNIRAGAYYIGEPVYLDRAYFLAELRGHEVLPGDILVAGLGDDNNLLGRSCVAPSGLGRALVKADCFRFRLNAKVALPEFVALQLSTGAEYDAGILSSGTTRSRIPLGTMASRKVALPPLEEQKAIVGFLDRESAKIDALIAEQEKLIALLAEKRQATISHAVTRGLDPNVPMKDSGVPWLGEVPAHWKVGPVKYFFSSLDGQRIPLSAEERGLRQGEYPYYGASGVIDSIDSFIFDDDLVLVSEDGANLLNRSTPIAFIASGKYWVNNHAHILRPPDNNLQFWAERIESIDLRPFVTGSAQPKLTIAALMNLAIAAPQSEEERAAITEFIGAQTTKLDQLTREVMRATRLLKERRSTLIGAAVTGQIDVRGIVEAAASGSEDLA